MNKEALLEVVVRMQVASYMLAGAGDLVDGVVIGLEQKGGNGPFWDSLYASIACIASDVQGLVQEVDETAASAELEYKKYGPEQEPGALLVTRMKPERLALVVFNEVVSGATSLDDSQHIGSDLAYLMGAILCGSHVRFGNDSPIMLLLRARFPGPAAVWGYVRSKPALDTPPP